MAPRVKLSLKYAAIHDVRAKLLRDNLFGGRSIRPVSDPRAVLREAARVIRRTAVSSSARLTGSPLQAEASLPSRQAVIATAP